MTHYDDDSPYRVYARTTDPETSHLAAEDASEKSEGRMATVMRVLTDAVKNGWNKDGFVADEIVALVQFDKTQAHEARYGKDAPYKPPRRHSIHNVPNRLEKAGLMYRRLSKTAKDGTTSFFSDDVPKSEMYETGSVHSRMASSGHHQQIWYLNLSDTVVPRDYYDEEVAAKNRRVIANLRREVKYYKELCPKGTISFEQYEAMLAHQPTAYADSDWMN